MYKNLIWHLLSGVFLLSLFACSVSEISETASMKTPAAPKPGDCIACHEDKEVIPADHPDTKDMKNSECGSCHQAGSNSLFEKIPQSHMHKLAGISCKGCHEDPASPKPVDSDTCKTCHNDMKALYSATSEVGLNPHFSPHEGKVPDCNRCHHQHKVSENFCTGCHQI